MFFVRMSQAYCSALPVSYCRPDDVRWTEFARLVLEATYEATVCAAILNAERTGNNTLFLTRIGGKSFGNSDDWIRSATKRALTLYQHARLDVVSVSFSGSKPKISKLAAQLAC